MEKRIFIHLFPEYYRSGMKIKKIQISEKDKRKAYRTAVRKASQEAGLDKITRPKIYKNRKKYTRKGKQKVIREEQSLG
jgi:hypothetical protein